MNVGYKSPCCREHDQLMILAQIYILYDQLPRQMPYDIPIWQLPALKISPIITRCNG